MAKFLEEFPRKCLEEFCKLLLEEFRKFLAVGNFLLISWRCFVNFEGSTRVKFEAIPRDVDGQKRQTMSKSIFREKLRGIHGSVCGGEISGGVTAWISGGNFVCTFKNSNSRRILKHCSKLFTAHFSLLTPHLTLLNFHNSLLNPCSSLLTPHFTFLTYSSLLTPTSNSYCSVFTEYFSLVIPSLFTPHYFNS